MLTENHIKEGLSRAYIQAVAHRAGFNLSFREFDYGIDGTVSDITMRGSRRVESGFKIDFQAKACSSPTSFRVEADHVFYDLEVKNHHDLCAESGTPRILIVLHMPEDDQHWLTTSDDELVLKRCAWWATFRGTPPTGNAESVRVKIPRAQRFDVLALNEMMTRVREGGLP